MLRRRTWSIIAAAAVTGLPRSCSHWEIDQQGGRRRGREEGEEEEEREEEAAQLSLFLSLLLLLLLLLLMVSTGLENHQRNLPQTAVQWQPSRCPHLQGACLTCLPRCLPDLPAKVPCLTDKVTLPSYPF